MLEFLPRTEKGSIGIGSSHMASGKGPNAMPSGLDTHVAERFSGRQISPDSVFDMDTYVGETPSTAAVMLETPAPSASVDDRRQPTPMVFSHGHAKGDQRTLVLDGTASWNRRRVSC